MSDPTRPTPTTIKSVQLCGMPDELLKLVVEHLRRPIDLVSLSLTSRRLKLIATPCLYRTIRLYLGTGSEEKVITMLNPLNTGLQHVKHVEIYVPVPASPAAARSSALKVARLTVRTLLEFLPIDGLHRFVWNPTETMGSSNLALLINKQKKLMALQSMCIGDGSNDDLLAVTTALRKQTGLQALWVRAHCGRSLRIGREMVDQAGEALKSLYIQITSSKSGYFDSANGIGHVNTELFASQLALVEGDLLQLKDRPLSRIKLVTLQLDGANLKFGAQTYALVIDTSSLLNLTVRHCPGVEALFAQLDKGANLPHGLKKLTITHTDDAEDDGMTSLDGFLCLITGLERLVLDFEKCGKLPQVSSVTRHSASLQMLVVHSTKKNWGGAPITEVKYSANEISSLLTACQELKELSISFVPPSVFTKDPTVDGMAPWFFLSQGKNLRTVQITPYPTTPQRPLEQDCYTLLVKRITANIFERHVREHGSASMLNVVAFGASDTLSVRKSSPHQLVFVKAHEPAVLGEALGTKKVILPVQTTAEEARYIEDDSEILRTYLGVSKDRPQIGKEGDNGGPAGRGELI